MLSINLEQSKGSEYFVSVIPTTYCLYVEIILTSLYNNLLKINEGDKIESVFWPRS